MTAITGVPAIIYLENILLKEEAMGHPLEAYDVDTNRSTPDPYSGDYYRDYPPKVAEPYMVRERDAIEKPVAEVEIDPQEGRRAIEKWLDMRWDMDGVEVRSDEQERALLINYLNEYINEIAPQEGDRQLQHIALAMRHELDYVEAGLARLEEHANLSDANRATA